MPTFGWLWTMSFCQQVNLSVSSEHLNLLGTSQPPLIRSTSRNFNLSTSPHAGMSTSEHFNMSTSRHFNLSTYEAPQSISTSSQPLNLSSSQPFKMSASQQFTGGGDIPRRLIGWGSKLLKCLEVEVLRCWGGEVLRVWKQIEMIQGACERLRCWEVEML